MTGIREASLLEVTGKTALVTGGARGLGAAAAKKLAGRGRILVRYSGTEMLARVMVEGKNRKLVNAIAKGIASAIKKEAKK